MRATIRFTSRSRGHHGASNTTLIISVFLLLLLGAGGWVGYSYYQLLSRAKKLRGCLDNIHRYRGAQTVTRKRILATAVVKIRAAGGRVQAKHIKLELSPLTIENGTQLPRMMRTKISMTCHMKKIDGVRDNRIARIKRNFAMARTHGNRTADPPASGPVKPPDLGGGLGCSADRLAELDYTFVLIETAVTVKAGLLTRKVKLKKKFFLPQPPPSDDDDDEDSDDEE